MDDKSSSPLGLSPATWITLAVAFMGIFALRQAPFQDSRPTDLWNPVYSHPASEDQDVEARLWQDPMAAVETARNVNAAPRKSSDASINRASKCPDPFDTTESGKALLSNVHSARHLCAAIQNAAKDSGVIVLAAMVSGAPYAADIENRRRTRYAVLAGLYRSNYMPMNSGHVGYVHLMDFYDDPAHASDLAAFEWFFDASQEKQSRPAHLLLLWLDQDGFSKTPIAQLARIADGVMPAGMPAALLGPADSDGLREMVSEFKAPGIIAPPSPSRSITVFSPRATAANGAIMESSINGEGSTERSAESMPTELAPKVHLYRAIATDDKVADAMRGVLSDRHVHSDEIALVVERDTLYGRTMGENFTGCENPPSAQPDTRKGPYFPHPVCLTYLRGLDGVGPPPPKRSGTPGATSANYGKASGQTNKLANTSDASSGPGQLDYLRRLGLTLTAMQGAKPLGCDDSKGADQACGPRYIKAIGVLGTDIYDKLLILQELRPTFPDAIFFTFDLDGRLSDSANLPWTRDLLVGSSLSLSLRQELQGDIPAFRDSYQSATFYSTMLAVDRATAHDASRGKNPAANAGLEWAQHPQIFEIGRKKPLDLLLQPERMKERECSFNQCGYLSDTRSDHFAETVSRVAGGGIVALTFAVLWLLLRLALGNNTVSSPWKRTPMNLSRLFAVLIFMGILAMRWDAFWQTIFSYVTTGNRYMPAPIADGAGHWGRDFLEAAMVPLVLALLIRGQRKLQQNAKNMGTEFYLGRSPGALVRYYAAIVRTWSWKRYWMEWAYIPFGSLSGATNRLPARKAVSPLESLIACYLYRGLWQKRWTRVAAACIISGTVFAILEWLGFSLFVGVPGIVTLTQKRGVEGLITGLSFVSVQALIFWVIDAILLTRSFMLDVATTAPDWPRNSLNVAGTALGLPPDLTTIWLNLHLVSRRTTWVGNFIWYPSLVIAGLFAATFTVQYGQYRFDSNPVTLVVSIALIVTAVVMLRQSAESWRSRVLETLKHRRLALLAGGAAASPAVAQIKVLINLVTDLHEGAFAPYSQQPLVRAVLVPLLTFAATAGFPFLRPG